MSKVTVREVVMIDGHPVEYGPAVEPRFGSVGEVNEFLARYPLVRDRLRREGEDLRRLVVVK